MEASSSLQITPLVIIIWFAGGLLLCLLFFLFKTGRLGGRSALFFALACLLAALQAGSLRLTGNFTSVDGLRLEITWDDSPSMQDAWPVVKPTAEKLFNSLEGRDDVLFRRLSGGRSENEAPAAPADAVVRRSAAGSDLAVLFGDCRSGGELFQICPLLPSPAAASLILVQVDENLFAGKSFNTRLSYACTAACRIELKVDNKPAGKRELAGAAGERSLDWPLSLAAGSHRLEFSVSSDEDSHSFDNEAALSVRVQKNHTPVVVASSGLGYDFALWVRLAGVHPQARLVKKPMLGDQKAPGKKNEVLIYHNLNEGSGGTSPDIVVAGADHAGYIRQLYPMLKFEPRKSGFGRIRLTAAGLQSGFLPASLDGEDVELSSMVLVNALPAGWQVWVEAGKEGYPLVISDKKNNRVIVLSDGLYKNHFLNVGLSGGYSPVEQLYGALIDYYINLKREHHFSPLPWFLHLDRPAAFKLPDHAAGSLKLFEKDELVRTLPFSCAEFCRQSFSFNRPGAFNVEWQSDQGQRSRFGVYVNHSPAEARSLLTAPATAAAAALMSYSASEDAGSNAALIIKKLDEALDSARQKAKAGVLRSHRFEWDMKSSVVVSLLVFALLFLGWYDSLYPLLRDQLARIFTRKNGPPD